jgi:short-subunit dehydrogenase
MGIARWERALVTGASSGIGEAFARQLAAQGTKVVAVARREERLRTLPGDVEVLVADLTTEDGIAAVEARLAHGDVDLLVNNAAFGTTGSLVTIDSARVVDEVTLDVVALTRLTRVALPPMLARGHGGVLNVASLVAYYPTPLLATYGASKSYVKSFSEAIAEEVRATGVRVTVLCPGLTRTEFQQVSGGADMTNLPRFAWQSADAVARAGLDGIAAGKVVVVPGAFNRTFVLVSTLVPKAVLRRAAARVQRLRGAATSPPPPGS